MGLARFDGKAGHEGIQVGVGVDLGGIDVKLFAPNQLRLAALLHNHLKEAPKHVEAVAGTDAGQAGVIGQGFVEIVPDVPAHTQTIHGVAHQEPFGANILKKHDQLEAKKYLRVYRWSPAWCIGVLDQVTDKGEVERALKVPIEVARRHQRLQRDGNYRGKRAFLEAHHSSTPKQDWPPVYQQAAHVSRRWTRSVMPSDVDLGNT